MGWLSDYLGKDYLEKPTLEEAEEKCKAIQAKIDKQEREVDTRGDFKEMKVVVVDGVDELHLKNALESIVTEWMGGGIDEEYAWFHVTGCVRDILCLLRQCAINAPEEILKK